MGHCIRGFIGKNSIIEGLSNSWQREAITLPQGFTMLFLTDELFDDITELSNIENSLDCPVLEFFTSSIADLMESQSFKSSLAYIETDYFGGVGSQAGVLFVNGKVEIEPTKGEGIINQILQKLGIYKEKDRDEFDSIHLGNYRHM